MTHCARFISKVLEECAVKKHPGYHICVTKQNLDAWVEMARPRPPMIAVRVFQSGWD